MNREELAERIRAYLLASGLTEQEIAAERRDG